MRAYGVLLGLVGHKAGVSYPDSVACILQQKAVCAVKGLPGSRHSPSLLLCKPFASRVEKVELEEVFVLLSSLFLVTFTSDLPQSMI